MIPFKSLIKRLLWEKASELLVFLAVAVIVIGIMAGLGDLP
jgi:hypothetical protein